MSGFMEQLKNGKDVFISFTGSMAQGWHQTLLFRQFISVLINRPALDCQDTRGGSASLTGWFDLQKSSPPWSKEGWQRLADGVVRSAKAPLLGRRSVRSASLTGWFVLQNAPLLGRKRSGDSINHALHRFLFQAASAVFPRPARRLGTPFMACTGDLESC